MNVPIKNNKRTIKYHDKVFVVDGLVSNPLKTNKIKSDNFISNKTTDESSDTIPNLNDNKNTLQGIMKLPMIVAQCCGLFPVSGIGKPSANDLKFKWISWRTLFGLFCISGNISMAVFFYYWLAIRGLTLDKLGSLVFYSTSSICTLLFLRLAKIWPNIAQEWANVEAKFISYPNVKNKPRKYKNILIVILSFAFVEHSLAVAISFGWISKCTSDNLGITHIKADFPQWFCFIDYNHVKAIVVEYFNWVATFNWNFNDIFIILVSEVLTEKFRQINEKIKFAHVNVINDQFYKIIREDYTHLSHLCSTLNEAICHIVTLSFVSNIMHICIQLYNILRPRETLVEYFYFYFSLGFLIARAVLVSVYASSINDHSKIPLTLLNSVPSVWYNTEVSRLIQQIHTYSISLTGSNFFPVTRNLLISVGGTIVAYELVLIQLPRPLSKADIFLANATEAQKIAFICNVSRLCEP